ncbi:MAG: hypothetical protein KJS90_01310 [Acidobacteria bacterium]|nr:hypothetical protein [Acidobacteriota bacterium]
MPDSTGSRVTNQAAVVAVRATVGSGCSEDLAVEIVEVVRPHLEAPIFSIVKALQKELSDARAEIARLQQPPAN